MIKINDDLPGDSRKVPCVIALDAMGGDDAPNIVIDGAAIAHKKYPNVKFIFFGHEELISPMLNNHPSLKAVSSIRHTSDVINSEMKPSLALRQGRNSSMRLAINAVASREADCIVSAGNTGALMVLAKFVLKTLPGIDRPAIATLIPSQKGSTVVLDLGANIECDSENLVQFSLMGAIFCKTILGKDMPTIGLLNIGTEELKGHEEVRIAASILKERPLPGKLYGFIEGNDITSGTVDVVVTDGFSGNIALKSIEGTARLYSYFIKRTVASSLLAKIGFFLASFALADLRKKVDPKQYNGAMFLGLRGVCVKSHGSADAEGFSNAIGVALSLVVHGYNAKIAKEIAFQYGDDVQDDEEEEEQDHL